MPVVVTLSTVKSRLNKSLTVDDAEITAMIDAAEAEYAERVRPLPGAYTARFDGGGTRLILPPGTTAVTAASYTDGSVINVADLDLHDGLLGWNYNTAGRFSPGTRNVTLTYTVGPVPAHHVETIAADVAGYFENTQRGPSPLVDETGFGAAQAGTPVVLFPRIRALAVPRIG